MYPSATSTSQPFQDAVANALDRLRQAEVCLRQWRTSETHPEMEHELLHLTALAILAEQRGHHLMAKARSSPKAQPEEDLPAALARSHDELVSSFPGANEIVAFQFITEVEAVGEGVQRYVERR